MTTLHQVAHQNTRHLVEGGHRRLWTSATPGELAMRCCP